MRSAGPGAAGHGVASGARGRTPGQTPGDARGCGARGQVTRPGSCAQVAPRAAPGRCGPGPVPGGQGSSRAWPSGRPGRGSRRGSSSGGIGDSGRWGRPPHKGAAGNLSAAAPRGRWVWARPSERPPPPRSASKGTESSEAGGGGGTRAQGRQGPCRPRAEGGRTQGCSQHQRVAPRGGRVLVETAARPPAAGPLPALQARGGAGRPSTGWAGGLWVRRAGARGPRGVASAALPARPADWLSGSPRTPVPAASRAPGARRIRPAWPSAGCADPGAPSSWGCCSCWGRRGPAGGSRRPGRRQTGRRCCSSSWRSSRSSGSTTRGSPRGCSSRAGRTTAWAAGRSRTTGLTRRSREWVSVPARVAVQTERAASQGLSGVCGVGGASACPVSGDAGRASTCLQIELSLRTHTYF